ncbi:glycosyltransferase involved in cell wall biosynthesis [Novosphingobium fluoreni]|uniref:Glycosyltransferase involved in cell wall biosynthesis n=1 Tax=Novosphingobium fluoreni TaxID=1391222 RepID=A0A7W6C5T4_9SPHN|nr:glycosyltransferase family 4 protein [Novosphingobium fluoreni]MBB3940046.1 glycosyltransferase involved in cell wall biosynthesis [Novosphingobium fluoreni]
MTHVSRDLLASRPAQATEIRAIFDERAAAPLRPIRVALIGTYTPRKCGIATFTTDIAEKLREFRADVDVEVYALDDADAPLTYEGVTDTILGSDQETFSRAARAINESAVDAVWLQHEYGIYGDDDGIAVCDFVDRLAAPLILTCHTVLAEPSDRQRAILRHLVTRASRIMVMSRHSRDLLSREYGANPEILEVIEHGAPDRPFGRQTEFKSRFGLTDRKVLMTFGLLGPGKGLERAIEALPAIVKNHPEAIYRIVGATHPNLVASQGEAYREGLMDLAERLGVSDHIEWDNRFLDTDELLDQLEACDIYITPYPNLQQSTSGTLSYAVALGKAVISTRYLHACELLGDNVGCLIEPGSYEEIARSVSNLLDNPADLSAMQRRAYDRGRETIWPRFAEATAKLAAAAVAPAPRRASLTATPGLSGVLAMCDSTGMLQHAIGIVPDRRHGYCLDDNVRALMLMNVAEGLHPTERMRWSMIYASFIQDAWNPEAQRFRNFMRFDRSWCEDIGSDDSNGRAIWALGQTALCAPDENMREWARNLYEHVLPQMSGIGSPRAVAFEVLGAAAMLRSAPGHAMSLEVIARGGDLLERLLGGGRRPDWAWFEAVLGYDNPRLPQAMIEAGLALGRDDWTASGLETLEWICRSQQSSTGQFRPIGSESFGKEHTFLPFDQQPLEAQAAIEAALTAHNASEAAFWYEHASAAWSWFFGGNDRGVQLADMATGRCRDGVTPRGANRNCGAESILAFQLSHYAMLALYRMTAESR